MPFQVRKAVPSDAPAIARVHVDVWRSAYGNILPEELLKSLSYEQRAERHLRTLSAPESRAGWWVAVTAEDELIGFACGWKNRDKDAFDAELYAIYVLEDHQKKGAGGTLFRSVVGELVKAGFKSMKLWVFEENHHSRKFYEQMGGKLLDGKKAESFGGAMLTEVSYGWKNLQSLV